MPAPPGAPAPQAAQAAQDLIPRAASVTRRDLARALQSLERALHAVPHPVSAWQEVHRSFDRVVGLFFSGRGEQAVLLLKAMTRQLDGEPSEQAADRDRLRARALPAWAPAGRASTLSVSLEHLAADPLPTAPDLRAVFAPAGAARAPSRVLWESAGHPGPLASFDLPGDLPPGTIQILGRIGQAQWAPIERVPVLTDSPERLADSFQTRLDAAQAQADASSGPLAAIIGSRLGLLRDQPSESDSARFLADLPALAQQIDAELTALVAGTPPISRDGVDRWMLLPLPDGPVPARVLFPTLSPPPTTTATPTSAAAPSATTAAPGAAAAAGPAGAPGVLVTLHGAGGDENLFPDAYGAGVARDLAREHNLVLFSPRTEALLARPGRLLDALALLATLHPIDPDRVYVVGHSMGGGAAAILARAMPEALAGVVAIAGVPQRLGPGPIPPLLAIAAERDGLIPPAGILRMIAGATQAGLPVASVVAPAAGHTTVVNVSLPAAMAWLARHTRNAPGPLTPPEPAELLTGRPVTP